MKKLGLIIGLVLVSVVGYGQTKFELEVLKVLNEVRVSKELPKVKWDYNFPKEIIQIKDEFIENCKKGYMAHSKPTYWHYNSMVQGFGRCNEPKYTIDEVKQSIEMDTMECSENEFDSIFIKEYNYFDKINNTQVQSIIFFINYNSLK